MYEYDGIYSGLFIMNILEPLQTVSTFTIRQADGNEEEKRQRRREEEKRLFSVREFTYTLHRHG